MLHQRAKRPSPASLVSNGLLGVAQILVWGGSFFLMAVLADPVVQDTHWPHQWVYGSVSVGLFVSGILAPWAGRQIARPRTNLGLLSSGFVVGLGLMMVALAHSLWIFMLGWCIMGIGMAMGLYDALFAVLGKHYGLQAKQSITQITLISGFCSTVIWPLMGWLISEWGWRTACLGYGFFLWVSVWPLYKLALPGQRVSHSAKPLGDKPKPASAPIDRTLFWLVAVNLTLAAIIMTAMTVQLIDVLRAQGHSLTAAIGMGALIGPCQVGVRLLDLLAPRKHPIWTTFISSVLTVLGLLLLAIAPALAVAGVVFYSLGNGMRSILRGTLPLELFGPKAYPVVLGRLARPALLAQSLTPLLGGYLVQQSGPLLLLAVLTGLALLNIGTTAAIKYRMPQPSKAAAASPLLTH